MGDLLIFLSLLAVPQSNSTAREHEHWLELLQGRWTVTLEDEAGQVVQWQAAANGAALAGGVIDAQFRTTEVFGWEDDRRRLVHTGYGSDGVAYWRTEYKVSAAKLEGLVSGIMPGGARYRGTTVISKNSDNVLEAASQFTLQDGTTSKMSTTFRRQKE